MRSRFFIWMCVVVTLPGYCAAKKIPKALTQPAGLEVAEVVSSFPVGFDLMIAGERQFVAYYDADRRMTLAVRKLTSDKWEYATLDQIVPWDAHNYVTMTADRDGYIHLSGNMHGVPLIYYRTSNPLDINSFVKMDGMTGVDEKQVTYPQFMRNKAGELIFHYRSGTSGDGYEVYNIYDPDLRTWSRLLDKPLINGRGAVTRNAYMQGPLFGPDGYFHLIWVWRDTGDCATNHTLSYARSRDLQHWESIRGEQVALPITFEDTVLRVDPASPGQGLFNPGIKLSFDTQKRPVIGYHKYDEAGNNQLYLARFESEKWHLAQVTHWNYRWHIEGFGSMPTELEIDTPVALADGRLAFGYSHIQEGEGQVLVDQNTLKPIGKREKPAVIPDSYIPVKSTFPGMQVHTLARQGYLLRWETLPANKDRKPEVTPPPSKLILYKIR